MKLYTTQGHSKVAHPEFGEFEVDDEGAIEVPEELGVQLHGTHVGGVPGWETVEERRLRLVAEEDARRRDPATLLDAVERLSARQDEVEDIATEPKTTARKR
jgi:hypothetical protein